MCVDTRERGRGGNVQIPMLVMGRKAGMMAGGKMRCVVFPLNGVCVLQWVRGCELGAVRRGDSDIRCDSGAQGSV